MDIYLPIAGMSVNAPLIVVLGALVGVLSGLFGVGGGFLTTPLLIFYGIPPSVAVASATTQITGASVSGALAHMRRGGVDLGVWSAVKPSQLVMPLDAHVIAIARRVRLTRYTSPGWKMAVDITDRLRRFDPDDPVKYDFAFHRMGLWKKDAEIDSLR